MQGSLCASASEVLACTCVSPVSSPTPSRFTAVTLDQRCHTGAYIALLHCQLSPLCPAEMSGFMSMWFYAPTCLYFSLFHIPYRTWICIYMHTISIDTKLLSIKNIQNNLLCDSEEKSCIVSSRVT